MGRIVEPSLRLLSPVCLSDYWSQAKEKKWKSFLHCTPLFSFSPHPSGELLSMGFENWHFLLPFLIVLSQSAQVLFWLGFDWAAISLFFLCERYCSKYTATKSVQPSSEWSSQNSRLSNAFAGLATGHDVYPWIFQIFHNIKVYKNHFRRRSLFVKLATQ